MRRRDTADENAQRPPGNSRASRTTHSALPPQTTAPRTRLSSVPAAHNENPPWRGRPRLDDRSPVVPSAVSERRPTPEDLSPSPQPTRRTENVPPSPVGRQKVKTRIRTRDVVEPSVPAAHDADPALKKRLRAAEVVQPSAAPAAHDENPELKKRIRAHKVVQPSVAATHDENSARRGRHEADDLSSGYASSAVTRRPKPEDLSPLPPPTTRSRAYEDLSLSAHPLREKNPTVKTRVRAAVPPSPPAPTAHSQDSVLRQGMGAAKATPATSAPTAHSQDSVSRKGMGAAKATPAAPAPVVHPQDPVLRQGMGAATEAPATSGPPVYREDPALKKRLRAAKAAPPPPALPPGHEDPALNKRLRALREAPSRAVSAAHPENIASRKRLRVAEVASPIPGPAVHPENPALKKRLRVAEVAEVAEVAPPSTRRAVYPENPALKKRLRAATVGPPPSVPAAHRTDPTSKKQSRADMAFSRRAAEHGFVRKRDAKVENMSPHASSSHVPQPSEQRRLHKRAHLRVASLPPPSVPSANATAQPPRAAARHTRSGTSSSYARHPIFKRWVPTRWKGNHNATADRMGMGKLGIAPALRTDNFAKLVKATHESLLEADTTTVPILKDIKWTQEAMILFQNQFETHLQLYLADGAVAMRHAKRKTFYPDDLECANRIKGKEAARLTPNCQGGPM